MNNKKLQDIPKAYDPNTVEGRIYQYWLDGDYFKPSIDRSRKPFVVIMPPPNVTGELHMGHALTIALEDLMVRWHRMKGESTLYLPGTDHAGIATQVVVERMLGKENITRHEIGRKAFVKEVWTWVDRYGGTIYEQLKRLGASCDWTRKQFTLDDGPSVAVRTTFVNLYEKGLIYRGERIVNWCPNCATALSDLEVRHQEEEGKFYYIKYPFEDGEGALTIATVRPETLFGDSAVAVNPKDTRYAHLVGQNVILPIINKPIPIIADEVVDHKFGTGALKVTPGHDLNDFEIGERHDLPITNVMNLDGTMNENAGHYQGQERFEVRIKVADELDRLDLLEKVESVHHSVGHCDRSGDVVDPIISKQWYMKMTPLAEPAVNAVKEGLIKIIPSHFEKVYFNWMDNIRDWCISRQLWWGHRIPVWYCDGCEELMVRVNDPTICSQCGSRNLSRDPDVLDTWFSSALWPHSTLGWPDETDDLNYFYPTNVLETGHDILFFWVARMIMMGIENTSKIPFDTVYLHGLVRDPEGIKMSKSKGNVMDPLKLIDLYGADALRFALTTGNSPGLDMRLNESKMESSRNFANKLWNASRYVINILDSQQTESGLGCLDENSHVEDRWIISRLQRVAEQVQSYMERFQFGEAQRVIHDFLWNEYCDWYLEMSKIRLRSGDKTSLTILPFVLEKLLRLLHPFMPFITEEIWQNLVRYLPKDMERPSSLMIASYPEAELNLINDQAESQIETVTEIVKAIRNVRAEFRIDRSQKIKVIIDAPEHEAIIQAKSEVIKTLGAVEDIICVSTGQQVDSSHQVSLVMSVGTLTIPLEGVVDLNQESKRLSKEIEQIDSNTDRLSSRLKDKRFLAKAPEDVIERERQRLDSMKERRLRILQVISRLEP